MNRRNKSREGEEKKSFRFLVDTAKLSSHIGDCRIELLGNTEAIIEGCKGVVEYDDAVIVLNLGKLSIKFEGENLTLKCMNDTDAVVQGEFITIEYMR